MPVERLHTRDAGAGDDNIETAEARFGLGDQFRVDSGFGDIGDDIDIAGAVSAKMVKNALKYPADRFRGSARKYDDPPETD